jgi:hypothetical protein
MLNLTPKMGPISQSRTRHAYNHIGCKPANLGTQPQLTSQATATRTKHLSSISDNAPASHAQTPPHMLLRTHTIQQNLFSYDVLIGFLSHSWQYPSACGF